VEDKAVLRIIEKLEKIDGRLDGMDGRLDKMDRQLDRLESSVAAMETRLGRVEIRLTRLDGKVDAIAEQTAHLTEFETETRMRLEALEAAGTARRARPRRKAE
jgi:chromosome segregation ATPase